MKVGHVAPNNWPLNGGEITLFLHFFFFLKSFPKQKPHFLTISHQPHKHCQASPLQVLRY